MAGPRLETHVCQRVCVVSGETASSDLKESWLVDRKTREGRAFLRRVSHGITNAGWWGLPYVLQAMDEHM